MKQIFVTHTDKPKKKPLHHEMFHCQEKKDQTQIQIPNQNQLQEVQNNSALNTSALSTTTNSSNAESRKFSYNFFTNEMNQISVNPNINFNTNNTNNNTINFNEENEKNKTHKKKGDNRLLFSRKM